MEYLTDLVTTVPEGTSPVKVDELRAAEAVRAAELAKAGHLVRLWRPPLGPGEWHSIGCSAPPTRQSFAKSSPRYPFISG
jgi:muconolactone D-isomerase